jgi:uncharacterized protein YdaU (DUF1376 family)
MKSPAFQFYPDDFIGGTCDMSTKEVGAFIRLLCFQWSKGKIPSDEKKLSRIAGCNVTLDVLAKFPDGMNQRLEDERVKQGEYRAKQSAKGQLSALARANRGSTVVQPSVEPQGNSPSPSPISNSTLTESASPAPVGEVLKLAPDEPKTKKPDPPDPRREEFVEIFREYITAGGVSYDRPNVADNSQLKTLLKRKPDLTAEEWREYLLYIHEKSRDPYSGNLIKDCGSLALVCSKMDRIQTYKDRDEKK